MNKSLSLLKKRKKKEMVSIEKARGNVRIMRFDDSGEDMKQFC